MDLLCVCAFVCDRKLDGGTWVDTAECVIGVYDGKRICNVSHFSYALKVAAAAATSSVATSTAASVTASGSGLVAASHPQQHYQHPPLQPTTTVMVVREEGADADLKELIEGISTFFYKA